MCVRTYAHIIDTDIRTYKYVYDMHIIYICIRISVLLFIDTYIHTYKGDTRAGLV